MSKNVTLRIDEETLKKCRHAAVEEDMSLSAWITAQITKIIKHRESFKNAKKRAVKCLEKGFHLGGKPLTRDEVYERH
jgi:hypothetical protein